MNYNEADELIETRFLLVSEDNRNDWDFCLDAISIAQSGGFESELVDALTALWDLFPNYGTSQFVDMFSDETQEELREMLIEEVDVAIDWLNTDSDYFYSWDEGGLYMYLSYPE